MKSVRFSKWRLPAAAVLLLAEFWMATSTFAQTGAPRPDLTGVVHLTNGQPAAATVFISTAGPKTGTSTFCPSCYADCIKSAKADTQGRFKIESLDPTLLFRILVVAKDCTPRYVAHLDPTNGPVKVVLDPRNYAEAPPGNTLHGRVVDSHGAPIAGAAVEMSGIHTSDGGGIWGALSGVDPLAVTDEKGEFVLTARDPFASMDVKVEARTYARKAFSELTSGTTLHEMPMSEGATISGRVIWKGKPLAGVSVGIVSVDRSPGHFTGNFEIGTDAAGRFAFVNLPPNVQYFLYGIMGTLQDYGAVATRQVFAGGDGSNLDAGDLIVGAGHRITGRVVLDDGKPIPSHTRLMIGPEDAWDSLHVELDKDGRFDAHAISSGVVSLSLRVPGYRLSARNGSLDGLNFRLIGRLDKDVTNMTILFEKGAETRRDPDSYSMENRPEDRPLRGIEGGPAPDEMRSQSWTISGSVTNAKTGQPVTSFRVTPGNKRFRDVAFDNFNQAQGSNGVFTVNLSKRFSEPRLKIEADGYLPVAVTPPLEDRTNLAIQLRPGAGPSGIVLGADGKPAARAIVGLLCAGNQGMSITSTGLLTAGRHRSLVTITGDDGSFAFAPELDMENVAASSAEGFKLVTIADLAANPKIVLEPWGRVTGTLRRPSGPGRYENLDLAFASDTLADPWMLQTGSHVITDDQGRFEFDRVPPGKLELTYRVKMSENGWMPTPLQSITVSPGQTLELKIDAGERETAQNRFAIQQPKPARKIGAPINGTVVLPGGKPAAGVQVALMVPDEYLALAKCSLQIGADKTLQTLTDEAGRFTLPGVEGATGIVAVHEAGFARIALPGTNSPALTLQPWGEIHGTLRIGKRLGANQSVVLQEPGDRLAGRFGSLNYVSTDFKTQADDQGHFVITYVPPGEQRLTRVIPTGSESWSAGNPTTVNVKAGGITEVTVGGTGREVVGKAVFKNPPTTLDWKEIQFLLRTPQPSGADADQRSFPGRRYPADSATNGSFVFEDVSPGIYELTATVVRRTRDQGNIHVANVMPVGKKETTVPEGAAGRDGEAYDVGTFELRTDHPLKVGDPATPIEAETSDGQKLRLVDFRGKYVLLNFVGSDGNGPAFQPLNDTFEAFGKDDRLAMLSVGYLPAQSLKDFARANGITWTLATMGKRSTEFADYVRSTPSDRGGRTLLIDPEGKILAEDLHGDGIKEAVAKALAPK